ncbi:hypothetical protein [Streptomyces hilarionis]|uniref:hypothetical protein n=1 Tax=Streptomyces hilarionis TaxID=2839954 RepID=UPI002119EAAC|nr:hypothetical protein [Streptomyces hilarionis]
MKDLTDAVRVRNSKVAALRNAGARVSELAAQAIDAGAPSTALAKVLAALEPTFAQDRPHVCGQGPVVLPLRPASPPPQAFEPIPADIMDQFLHGPRRYSLAEAFEEGILRWKPATVRTYFKRSRKRDIQVPEGVTEGGTAQYTARELTTWVQAWEQQAGLPNGGRPTGPRPGKLLTERDRHASRLLVTPPVTNPSHACHAALPGPKSGPEGWFPALAPESVTLPPTGNGP